MRVCVFVDCVTSTTKVSALQMRSLNSKFVSHEKNVKKFFFSWNRIYPWQKNVLIFGRFDTEFEIHSSRARKLNSLSGKFSLQKKSFIFSLFSWCHQFANWIGMYAPKLITLSTTLPWLLCWRDAKLCETRKQVWNNFFHSSSLPEPRKRQKRWNEIVSIRDRTRNNSRDEKEKRETHLKNLRTSWRWRQVNWLKGIAQIDWNSSSSDLSWGETKILQWGHSWRMRDSECIQESNSNSNRQRDDCSADINPKSKFVKLQNTESKNNIQTNQKTKRLSQNLQIKLDKPQRVVLPTGHWQWSTNCNCFHCSNDCTRCQRKHFFPVVVCFQFIATECEYSLMRVTKVVYRR